MDDAQIIELFFHRDERAIRECISCYSNYCRTIAASILCDPADVEEVLSDAWMKAWESIPPNSPRYLRLYLGKITRNLALSTYRKKSACCRGGGQVELALEELAECVSSKDDADEWVQMYELEKTMERFLRTEPASRRVTFLRRYFYMEDIPAIAKRYGLQESNVRMMLARTRKKLKKYLIQEGYML